MPETIISPNDVYELALPGGYIIEAGEGTFVIYDELNGSGAIHISNYGIPHDYTFDLKSELIEFVRSVDKNINGEELQVKVSGYASSEFISQGSFWKIWVFFKNHHAVFASYNCDEKQKGEEINKVDRMMESLSIIT